MFQFFQYLLVLFVPGLIGAIFYSIVARCTTKINILIAMILNLFTFTAMITGLYYLHGVCTVDFLLVEFNCLSFTRKYVLLSTVINIAFGILFGVIHKIFIRVMKKPCFKN